MPRDADLNHPGLEPGQLLRPTGRRFGHRALLSDAAAACMVAALQHRVTDADRL
jgi:hypothetical protein